MYDPKGFCRKKTKKIITFLSGSQQLHEVFLYEVKVTLTFYM